MYRRDGRLVLSPSDLTKHQECRHLTALDLSVVDRRLDPPAAGPAEQTQLVADLGIAHELRYLESLEASGRSVARLSGERDEAATLEAMRAGYDVVHSAHLSGGAWAGTADFLLRTAAPSALGNWSYEVADAKLARRVKVPALLQIATYADRLAVLQGVQPERVCVVTGDGVLRPWRLVDVAACTCRARRRRLEGFLVDVRATRLVPIANWWPVHVAGQVRDRAAQRRRPQPHRRHAPRPAHRRVNSHRPLGGQGADLWIRSAGAPRRR